MDRDALSIFESLRARWLGALNISCGAFQGIMGTWVDRQLPLCHQTQVSRSLVIGHAVDPGLLLLREGTSGPPGLLASDAACGQCLLCSSLWLGVEKA